jgi:imidazolonepropionase-like amidohydrolase
MTKRMLPLGLFALLASTAIPAHAQTGERYVVGRGDAGNTLVVSRKGGKIALDYQSTENGRGPKVHETIVLDSAGLPTSWAVDGTTTFGSKVDERFERTGDRIVWRSQAEEGEKQVSGKSLYIVNDGSPYAMGIYAAALLKAPGNKLMALPYGELSLVKIRDTTATVGKAKVHLTRYRIDGIDVTPTYVTLDDQGGLIATGNVIREGFADAAKALGAGGDADEMLEAQRKLAHRFDAPVEIHNVRIFDPVKGVLSAPSMVTTYRGKVTGVVPYDAAAPIAKGNRAIDGAGGTLISGLHDMHAHLRARSGLFYLAAGVTSIRDQGNETDRMLDLMTKIEAGDIAGPHIVPNAFIEGVSPYSSHTGFLPATFEEAMDDVRWAADHGYFQIKIYNSLNPEWVKPLAAEAHRLGLGVSGHVPAFMTPNDAIRWGYNDIAHINQLMLGWVLKPEEDTRTTIRLTGMARLKDLDLGSAPVRESIRLMQEHKVALDTTAVIVERLMLSRARYVQPGDVDYLDHMPVAYQRYRRRSFAPVDTPQGDADYKAAFAKVMQTMKILHDKGIQLLPGTDDATGFTVQREIELYTLAGIPNAEALRLGTLAAEQYMRRDADYGTIERGKASDFFLIPGDPLKDIRAIKSVAMVMKGDTIYYPSEIYDYLGVKPFVAPPKMVK